MLALLPALIKLLPAIIGLVQTIIQKAHDNQLLEAGQAKAIADALTQAHEQVARAMAAADEADAKAGGDPAKVDPAIFEDGK